MSSPTPHDARLGETIDLVADLNAQDDDGLGWSLLSSALDPANVKVGSMLLAGNSEAIAVLRVVAVDDEGRSIASDAESGWRSGSRGEADQLEVVFDDQRAVGQHRR